MSDWQPTASIATLEVRATMLRAAREYFIATRALEVETPTLSAAAVTDVHLASVAATAMQQPRFLHTSPEYPMKRLLAAGCGDIWQICRVYRDGESGRWHNPEFTLIEWYRLGIDHHALMSDVERLIGAMLPPARHFDRSERLTYREAVQLHAGVDALDDPTAGAGRATGKRRHRCTAQPAYRSRWLPGSDHEHAGRPAAGPRPTHLHLRLPGLAGRAGADPRPRRVALRGLLDGIELANGFHELADAAEQRSRFEQDLAARAARGLPPMPVDEHFLAALEHGLPECSGVALGFDRLVMCATGAKHIDEVLAFPFDRA